MNTVDIIDTTSGSNSCCHYDLTNIIREKDKIYFPSYYLEDYFIDYFDTHDIAYKEIDNKISVSKNDISWETLYLIKCESYSAINWYEEMKEFTYDSSFHCIKHLCDLKKINIANFPKFIKLDTVSCKDTNHNGIFYNMEEVYDIFSKSSRIINTLWRSPLSKSSHYLFIREPDFHMREKQEARCFIYQRRLTAVSCETKINCKNILEAFIETIIEKLPYYDAVLDICIDKDNKCKLIEINNFGADSPCGAGLFNWREDYITLYGGFDKVVYKCSDSFE